MPTRRLINCLCAVGIGLVAMGILVGWVLRAQDASRRMLCQSNLRQVAITCHNYYFDLQRLPAATVQGTSLPPDRRFSWCAQVLPYTGSNLLYDSKGKRIDLKNAWDLPDHLYPDIRHMGLVNEPPAGDRPDLLCPVNPHGQRGDGVHLGHYIGIAGTGKDSPTLAKDSPRAGVFGYEDREVTLPFIQNRDGTSTTLLAVETAHQNGPWIAGGYPTCRGLDPQSELPYLGRAAQFSAFHHSSAGFWGSPRLVTNVVFADCSTRSFAANMDPRIFEALATMAGGETIPELID